MRYLPILLCTTLFLWVEIASGQYYDTGQDPASLKWMQIKTGRFTVIYPEKYGSGGLDFARSLDEAYSKLTLLYPEKKFKIPVVIHNFSTQSNGYVAWAPKRMEIYPTPEQNTIPLDPNRALAIHELAHVFQMESLNEGFSKTLSIIFGEQFIGVVASLLPLWFMEGDAVFAESVLTESGRGRSPDFQKQLKAIAADRGQMYSYDKMLNGSYRDFTPDHYRYGYQMVAWSKVKYDPQVWNKVLKFTANQPFTINPVNISLSRNAGITKKKLFDETFDSLKTLWTKDISTSNATIYTSVNPDKRGRYINYYSPVKAGNDSIIAIKTTLSEPPSFVMIKPSAKSEKRIHIPGNMYPWFITFAKGKLVWVETHPDPRWENRNYSVVMLMDLGNKTTRQLTFRSRYMSASVSPDGRMIAISENTADNRNNLVFINSADGYVMQSVPVPGNVILQRPQWSEDGKKLSVIYLTKAGEGIMSYSLAGQSWKILLEAGRDDLQSSFLRNDTLFFISSKSGTDNLYLINSENNISELTSSKFGANDLCISAGKILFSDYSLSGNNICITSIAESKGKVYAYNRPLSYLINRFDTIPKSAYGNSVASYTPEPYRKWQHLFRFHSWMPFYADINEVQSDPASVRPGFSVMSQNSLSTLISSVGYEYSADKRHKFHSRITLKGWYPVLESQVDYGDKPVISRPNNVKDPSEIRQGLRFTNFVSIPLIFSSGKFTQYFYPSFSEETSNSYINANNNYDYSQTEITGRLYFLNYYRSAIRDIYPRWAQTIDLDFTFAPFDKKIYGTATTLKTSFYLPGLFSNHGIKLRYEKEKQVPVMGIFFGNRVFLPRGYNNIFPKDIEFLSVDYVFPVAYPDFSLASLLYLKRIRTGLFYDYASGPGNSFYKTTSSGLVPLFNHSGNESFKSFGFELLADFHLLRIPYLISGGVQTAWKNLSEKPSFELLFNIDLYGMTIGRRLM